MRELRAIWLGLLACTVVTAAPHPTYLGLRNDSQTPLMVQTASVINNKVCPGRSIVLYPGEVTWDCVVQPCLKNITIFDAKTKKLLLEKKGTACGTSDVFFSVQSAGGQVRLVPAAPPPRR